MLHSIQPCSGTSSQWDWFYRCRNDYLSKTDSQRTDYSGRDLATAGIGLAVGAGMYVIGIAAMVLTLIGLEVLSYLFKSIGMKSSMITFSTDNKEVLKGVADRFNSKDYLIVSYQMDTQKHGSIETYQVTMIIKSKRNNDEGHLLSLIQEFPEVTVERIE